MLSLLLYISEYNDIYISEYKNVYISGSLIRVVGWSIHNELQRQTAVTAYFSSKQLLLFVFVRQLS